MNVHVYFCTWLSVLNPIYMEMIELDLLTFMNTLISQNNETFASVFKKNLSQKLEYFPVSKAVAHYWDYKVDYSNQYLAAGN